MSLVVGARFKEIGKIRYFIYPQDDISEGELIIAQTKRGIECGKVIAIKKELSESRKIFPDEKIIRKANEKDLKSLELKEQEEKKAWEICKNKIAEHKLKMKIIDVEYMFDRSKLIFYFISESRVDFRSLVKDLAYTFKVRIELRQVGIRDEARILGGLGICGKPLCCSTFLSDFQSISVKMAKDQGISLNPVKLSGICGRLKCCLKYEQETYLDLISKMPAIGETVGTDEGVGTVIARSPITGMIKVQLQDGTENHKTVAFDVNEVWPLSGDNQ